LQTSNTASRRNAPAGGGSGIGLGISKALAALGAHVVLVGRRENVVADAAAAIRLSPHALSPQLYNRLSVLIRSSGLQAMHVACDVRSAAACEGVVKLVVDKLKAVHILVNCAAGAAAVCSTRFACATCTSATEFLYIARPNPLVGNFLCSAQDLSFNAFKTVLDIDLLGSFNMCACTIFPQ
jgi:NAD(P)-dependent dehydrogenase (short-subunit alcohol dehydrogenase family)